MVELGGAAPDGKLLLRRGNIGRDEFDGSLAWFGMLKLGQEDGAVIGIGQELQQRKLIIDNMAFAIFPEITHVAPLQRNRTIEHRGGQSGCKCTELERRGLDAYRIHFRTNYREGDKRVLTDRKGGVEG